MESPDEHMEALRQAVRRTAGPPSAEMMAASTKTRAARARIAELQREIAELACTVQGREARKPHPGIAAGASRREEGSGSVTIRRAVRRQRWAERGASRKGRAFSISPAAHRRM